jgi:hypothetical protein
MFRPIDICFMAAVAFAIAAFASLKRAGHSKAIAVEAKPERQKHSDNQTRCLAVFHFASPLTADEPQIGRTARTTTRVRPAESAASPTSANGMAPQTTEATAFRTSNNLPDARLAIGFSQSPRRHSS